MPQPIRIPSRPLKLLNAREAGVFLWTGIPVGNRLERAGELIWLTGGRQKDVRYGLDRCTAVSETLNGDNH